MRLTRIRSSLVAAAASVLTSAVHAAALAIFGNHTTDRVLIAGYMGGRVLGDLPVAALCFARAYVSLNPDPIASTSSPPVNPGVGPNP